MGMSQLSGSGKNICTNIEERAIMDFLYYGYVPNRNAACYAARWYQKVLTDPAIPFAREGDHAAMRGLFQTIMAEIVKSRRPTVRDLLKRLSGT